jgi:hypothetical protein
MGINICNCSGSTFSGSRFKVKLTRPPRLSESDGGQVKERLYECGIHPVLAKRQAVLQRSLEETLCCLVNVKIVMQATLNREPNNLSTNIGYV